MIHSLFVRVCVCVEHIQNVNVTKRCGGNQTPMIYFTQNVFDVPVLNVDDVRRLSFVYVAQPR